MTTTKRAQSGSAGAVLVLAIIVIGIWWQWDRIEALVGVGTGGMIAEVSGFSCTAQSSGRSLMEGRVRNISKEPVAFRVLVNVVDTSGRRVDTQEVAVRPSPVPPEQGGEFRTDGPAIPDGGSCRLDNVLSAETGYPVKFRRR